MKIKTIIFFMSMLICSSCYASGQWVPYNQPQIIVQEYVIPPQVLAQTIRPLPTYYYEYQLVPHVVLRPVIKTTKRIFFKEETVEQMVPVTEWVYQPVLVYR